MIRKSLVFVLLVVLLPLIGCRSSVTGTTQTTPTSGVQSLRYLTALEAYAEIRSTMQAWHADAFVSGIYSSRSEQPEKRVRADGRATEWNFNVYSPGAQRLTYILWTNGEIRIGIPDAPGGEVSVSGWKSLPIDRMIDSSRSVEIALQNGAGVSDTLYYITIDGYDGKAGKPIPTSWGLTYDHPYDWSQQKMVLVNVVTSEVLRNDFNPPPPTPTSEVTPKICTT